MKKVTRRNFLRAAASSAAVITATMLVGCSEGVDDSGTHQESSSKVPQDGSASNSSSTGSSTSEGNSPSNPPEPPQQDEFEWQKNVLPVNANLNTVSCTLGDLDIWAEASGLALYREDLEKDAYIWHGEGALGLEFSVTNSGGTTVLLSTGDFSATLDGKNIKFRTGEMAIHGDSLCGFFDRENPRKIAAGESCGEVIAFDVPTEAQYTKWKKMVIEFHPECVATEKVVYTLERSRTIQKPIFSAVKMVKKSKK